jgi:diaminopimelate epimerase
VSALQLYKAHALGNDYLAVDGEGLPGRDPARAARILCERHRGAGSDGLLVRVPSTAADFGLRIFNPDGSEAEKSGNGLRIFGAFLRRGRHLGGRTRFTVETASGVVEMTVHPAPDDGPLDIEVEMGPALFDSEAVGLTGDPRETDRETIELEDGRLVSLTAVSVGNPHAVVFGEPLDEEGVREIAGALARHPSFTRGVNVQLAEVLGPGEVGIRIWERGVGPTLASGSSSCAAAAAAVRRGLVEAGPVTVRMPGGTLQVRVAPDWSLTLRGPVEEVYMAEIAPALLARLSEEG